jgi:hypothetical protein
MPPFTLGSNIQKEGTHFGGIEKNIFFKSDVSVVFFLRVIVWCVFGGLLEIGNRSFPHDLKSFVEWGGVLSDCTTQSSSLHVC